MDPPGHHGKQKFGASSTNNNRMNSWRFSNSGRTAGGGSGNSSGRGFNNYNNGNNSDDDYVFVSGSQQSQRNNNNNNNNNEPNPIPPDVVRQQEELLALHNKNKELRQQQLMQQEKNYKQRNNQLKLQQSEELSNSINNNTSTRSLNINNASSQRSFNNHNNKSFNASNNQSFSTLATNRSSNTSQHQQQRRQSLHKKAPSLSKYQTTSITKHYEISRQILAAFDSHWSNHLWVTAYAVGLQFVELALLEIPKHGYFYSSRHERERMQNSLEAARVAHLLQELLMLSVEQQNNEAIVTDEKGLAEPTAGLVPGGDLPKVRKLLALALDQVEEASSDQDSSTTPSQRQQRYQAARAKIEEELRADREDNNNDHNSNNNNNEWIVCEPLLSSCSESFSNLCSNTNNTSTMHKINGVDVEIDDGNSTIQTTPLSPSTKSIVTERYSIMSLGTTANNTVTTRTTHNTGLPYISNNLSYDNTNNNSSSNNNNFIYPQDDASMVLPVGLRSDRSLGASVSTVQTDDLSLQKALFLSGLEVSDYANNNNVDYYNNYNDHNSTIGGGGGGSVVVGQHHTPSRKLNTMYEENDELQLSPIKQQSFISRKSTATMLELATLANLYHEDFDSLQADGRVRISFAETFQGRLPESTNGCTVIAPILCIHHLANELSDYHYRAGGDPGLKDDAIEECIDVETPSILGELRSQLGLSEHAFLIPADAHDYLIEHGQLSQDQFQNVVGGNILDDRHLNEFVSALTKISNIKIAATLFFHEHVIAILKLKRVNKNTGKVTFWYDFIDSLPLKETMRRSTETPSDLCTRLGLYTGMNNEQINEENEMIALPKTARIRCLDTEALIAVIRWYACSKFNDENINYIDQYPWDDTNYDFDPRVFQAFIWSGAPYYR